MGPNLRPDEQMAIFHEKIWAEGDSAKWEEEVATCKLNCSPVIQLAQLIVELAGSVHRLMVAVPQSTRKLGSNHSSWRTEKNSISGTC